MNLIELKVENVRGLRDLHLQMDGKNVVISGANGAGKSCVVDAIDFLFTGNISRLTGAGTRGISLSRHGPHIDEQPKTARVTAAVRLEGLGAPVQIERCMDEPDLLICPDEARAPLNEVAALMQRGGVILTRRDILRYVTAEAGKRADEIELLLNLKDIDDVRSALQRAKTELSRDETASNQAIKTAQADVNVTLSLNSFSDEGLLQMVNELRETLGGTLLDLPKSAGLREGISPQSAFEPTSAAVNPVLIRAAMQNIQLQVAADLANADELLRRDVAELKANEALLEELERLELTEQAARFVDDSTTECPICGTEWPEGHLQQHLATKLAAARNAKLTRDNIQLTAEMIAAPARELKANVTALTDGLRAVGVDPESEDAVALDNWSHSLDDLLKALINPIEQYLDSGLKGEQVATLCKPKSLDDLLNRVVSRIGENLPEPTPGQTAWDKLTRLEESVRALESRIREQQTASRNSERSNILLSEFDKARDLVLGSLYTKIAQRFVDYYSLLHDHERENFSASLRPQRASLNFEVDFLGRGNHPPHALHSEGHQDSMGVCLFLALNEELAVGKPGFFVLDDVVMSVDAGHRKDICRLLNDRFSESQFIITTHDRTWAKQLKQERVVEGPRDIEFTNWTLETGPHTHQQIDLWEGIKSDLARDDVHEAAFKLRRGSEDFFERVCDALGAQVTYNSEMRWQLDDWLGAAQSQYKDLVARALRAASSWSNQEAVETLKEVESVRKQVFDQISIEQWAINAAVHYNNWENLSTEEFEVVADAFKGLHGLFECSACGQFLEAVPRKNRPEVVKCRCGKVNWNLHGK